jgi:hypothetical protein
MLTKKFQKRKEDFMCEHCSFEVKGTGYTNHCPQCLWSKHVDVNPGDRAATCGGMMKPVRVETEKGLKQLLTHRCEKCGYEKRNRLEIGDNFDAVLAVVKAENESKKI